MTLSRRDDYGHGEDMQAPKDISIVKSKALVLEIQKALEPFVCSCEIHESEESIHNAPAVRIAGNRLVISPDLKCVSKGERVFWVEVKDKSQRFYYPDTGADLHQVLGWYDIWKHLKEPVLLVFRDPPLDSCMPKATTANSERKQFEKRWRCFGGRPYGNWLSNCLLIKEHYPQIFAEHSRDMDMYILYFHISRMTLLGDRWELVISDLDYGKITPLPEGIRAYLHGKSDLLGESGIRRLAIGQ